MTIKLPVPRRYFVPSLPSLARSGHPYGVRVSDSATVPHTIKLNWCRPSSNHHNFSTTWSNHTLRPRIISRKLLVLFFLTQSSYPRIASRFNVPARYLESHLKGTPSRSGKISANRKLCPADKAVVARAKEEVKAVKEVEKAVAAKVKEDAKIVKEIVKTAKKAMQMMMVGHGGVTLVEPVIEE